MTKTSFPEVVKSILQKLRPYRYPILILFLGVFLMLLPGEAEKQLEEPIIISQEIETDGLEQRLEALLSQIEGAGAVRVLLSPETGMASSYQLDRQRRTQGDDVEVDEKTVLVSENGNDRPVVVQQTYPIYKGAVVVCQGADSAAVKLNIVRAVSSLTGLGSDKITVVKMKG